ncbi:MAG: hypothetical protein NTV33_11850 [Coprothermobacterota bacterium]|nr:hypothetical protein [Coprothermobacterota bacterium]
MAPALLAPANPRTDEPCVALPTLVLANHALPLPTLVLANHALPLPTLVLANHVSPCQPSYWRSMCRLRRGGFQTRPLHSLRQLNSLRHLDSLRQQVLYQIDEVK